MQGYFVNLLKTISLKLNEVTVQFFFQVLCCWGCSPWVSEDAWCLCCLIVQCRGLTLQAPDHTQPQAGGSASSSGGRSPGSPGRPASFPLYSEAVKFVNHRWVGCAVGLYGSLAMLRLPSNAACSWKIKGSRWIPLSSSFCFQRTPPLHS